MDDEREQLLIRLETEMQALMLNSFIQQLSADVGALFLKTIPGGGQCSESAEVAAHMNRAAFKIIHGGKK